MEVDTAKRTGTAFCSRCCISILRRHSTQKDCEPFSRDSKQLIATWSSQSPRQSPCVGADGLHGMGFACRGRLPPGIAATAALFSPQCSNSSSVTLCKPLCASVSPVVKRRRRYFSLLRSSSFRNICEYGIYQQDNTTNTIIITINVAIILLLVWSLC